jgi:hypothetical protein
MTYKKIKNCEKCGKEIIVRTSTHRFCPDCLKIYNNEYRKKYYMVKEKKENHNKVTENWRRNHLEIKRKIQEKYRKEHPEIIIAHKIARQIPLHSNCDICKTQDKLQRHHWDYEKPLLINTLCKECHDIQHINNFNESCFRRY